MSILVLVQAKIKTDSTSKFKSYLAEILPDTRAFDGCNLIDLYSETNKGNNIVLVENWDSREHYNKYHTWRTKTGVIDKIRIMIDGTANIKFFKIIDA